MDAVKQALDEHVIRDDQGNVLVQSRTGAVARINDVFEDKADGLKWRLTGWGRDFEDEDDDDVAAVRAVSIDGRSGGLFWPSTFGLEWRQELEL